MKKMLLLLPIALADLSATAQVNQNQQYINPYLKKDGTFVDGHWRTAPNGTKEDNLNYNGNYPSGNASVFQPYYNYQALAEAAYYNAALARMRQEQIEADLSTIFSQTNQGEKFLSEQKFWEGGRCFSTALIKMKDLKLKYKKGWILRYNDTALKLALCHAAVGNRIGLIASLAEASTLTNESAKAAKYAAFITNMANDAKLTERYLKKAVWNAIDPVTGEPDASEYFENLIGFYRAKGQSEKADKITKK